MLGYMIDNANKRLWIRPSIPTVMGKKITQDAAGPVTIELVGVNGALMGTLLRDNATVGHHAFIWSGKFIEGKKAVSWETASSIELLF